MSNRLIVIEKGVLSTYLLDDKIAWEVGRNSKENKPDIAVYSPTVSRRHGKFQNIDGVWFYIDNKSKNGTIYNDKLLTADRRGRIKPVLIEDGDTFIFGGGENPVVNSKTIWAMFTTSQIESEWRVVDTKGCSNIKICSEFDETAMSNPSKGTVVRKDDGIVIYMGDITYAMGEVSVRCS